MRSAGSRQATSTTFPVLFLSRTMQHNTTVVLYLLVIIRISIKTTRCGVLKIWENGKTIMKPFFWSFCIKDNYETLS